ncbi:Premnaspirodiene oxygenase [Triticum urartu]|uniref:Premnaspirodiene oxygenase n=1 Tax=Triticum urartu TaxID=4572 RepID=M7ZRZ6_TRIUA|nr:Premnaspirodiene oxygenase [Triticum urartu]
MRDLARRYDAPLMLLRLGELNVVVASSAVASREIMTTHDATFATRPRTATLRAITTDDLAISLAPHGEQWRRLKKLCVTEVLSARQVRSLRGCREANAAALVSSIVSSLSSSSEPVNISSLITTHVTNLAVHALVGKQNEDLRAEFLKCLDEGIKLASGFSLADLFPSSRLARAFSSSIRRMEALNHEISQLIGRIIEEHRTRRSAGGGEEEDIVDVLLRIQSDGSETSVTTLQWVMAELMRSPAALRRVQAEVRNAFAGQSCIKEEALQELRYLHLVIKESLRLHPVLPLLLPRECQEPCHVLGYDVPKGTIVLVNAWAIGRDSASWGADAEEFRPERFEEAGDAAADFRGTNFELVPFGAGNSPRLPSTGNSPQPRCSAPPPSGARVATAGGTGDHLPPACQENGGGIMEQLPSVCQASPRPKELCPLLREKKLYIFVGLSIGRDKEKLKLSGLEINPDKYVDMQRKWRVPNNGKKWQSLAEFAASLIQPSYKEMKGKINKKLDHKRWGDSPLPNNLIEYAAKDAYVTYEASKKIETVKEGLEQWEEAEDHWDDPYYWGY